jgi:hypothetical protein
MQTQIKEYKSNKQKAPRNHSKVILGAFSHSPHRATEGPRFHSDENAALFLFPFKNYSEKELIQ